MKAIKTTGFKNKGAAATAKKALEKKTGDKYDIFAAPDGYFDLVLVAPEPAPATAKRVKTPAEVDLVLGFLKESNNFLYGAKGGETIVFAKPAVTKYKIDGLTLNVTVTGKYAKARKLEAVAA